MSAELAGDLGVVARVRGERVSKLPEDLYIPPDALEVVLEAFEGPLDLLLYLIRRHNLDILDIPVAQITHQYIEYIALMREMRFELAAEYLVMAAILAEIKSRMLLPRTVDESGEEEDPRAELIRRLQEYERFRQAALDLDALPRIDRDLFQASAAGDHLTIPRPQPNVDLRELFLALSEVMTRAQRFAHHTIEREQLSVRERMSQVLQSISDTTFTEFTRLFDPSEGRIGVVVTFLAILELVRETLVELAQDEPLGPIYLRARA